MVESSEWPFGSLAPDDILVKYYLYLLEAGGLFKVGISNDVRKRLAGLQGASPVPVRLVMYRRINRATARRVEKYAHERLREHHSHGEWFRCAEDVARAAVIKASKEHHLVVMRRIAKALNARTVGYSCHGACRNPDCKVCQLRRAGCWLHT